VPNDSHTVSHKPSARTGDLIGSVRYITFALQNWRCCNGIGGEIMERDVVCGMTVDPAKAPATSVYNGQTYYFCAKACKNKFDADPQKYAK
jgi:YHS domain-containing protein